MEFVYTWQNFDASRQIKWIGKFYERLHAVVTELPQISVKNLPKDSLVGLIEFVESSIGDCEIYIMIRRNRTDVDECIRALRFAGFIAMLPEVVKALSLSDDTNCVFMQCPK